jgi:hypothetical protein
MTTNHPSHDEQDTSNVNVDAILAKRGQIAVPWSIEDVQGIRPHLTTEQAWEVLEEVKRKHDAEYGISWTTLEIWADMLFRKPAQPHVAEERP